MSAARMQFDEAEDALSRTYISALVIILLGLTALTAAPALVQIRAALWLLQFAIFIAILYGLSLIGKALKLRHDRVSAGYRIKSCSTGSITREIKPHVWAPDGSLIGIANSQDHARSIVRAHIDQSNMLRTTE